ncbi:MAG: hypothetical protein WDW38_010978 [Sanguina aurantia]
MVIQQLPPELVSVLRTGISIDTMLRAVVEVVANSIDAGSRNIRVKLDLPNDSFSCMDDGCGIQAASFQSNVGNVRYSTSKLFTAADLDQGISTQGFRGEFLASLIEVASVHICSRAVGSSECHTKVFEAGGLRSFSPSSQPLPHTGTMVMVSSFMWNRPVRQRQRAAGSLSRERSEVLEALLRLMIPYTDTGILVTDGRAPVLSLVQGRTSGSTWQHLFSGSAGLLIPVSLSEHASVRTPSADATHPSQTSHAVQGEQHMCSKTREAADPPRASGPEPYSLEGVVGSLRLSSAGSDQQFLYINQHHIRDPHLSSMIHHLFAKALLVQQGDPAWLRGQSRQQQQQVQQKTCNPVFCLHLSCPGSDYSISSDPSKSVATFKHIERVCALMGTALSQAWGGASAEHSMSPTAQPVPRRGTLHPQHVAAGEQQQQPEPLDAETFRGGGLQTLRASATTGRAFASGTTSVAALQDIHTRGLQHAGDAALQSHTQQQQQQQQLQHHSHSHALRTGERARQQAVPMQQEQRERGNGHRSWMPDPSRMEIPAAMRGWLRAGKRTHAHAVPGDQYAEDAGAQLLLHTKQPCPEDARPECQTFRGDHSMHIPCSNRNRPLLPHHANPPSHRVRHMSANIQQHQPGPTQGEAVTQAGSGWPPSMGRSFLHHIMDSPGVPGTVQPPHPRDMHAPAGRQLHGELVRWGSERADRVVGLPCPAMPGQRAPAAPLDHAPHHAAGHSLEQHGNSGLTTAGRQGASSCLAPTSRPPAPRRQHHSHPPVATPHPEAAPRPWNRGAGPGRSVSCGGAQSHGQGSAPLCRQPERSRPVSGAEGWRALPREGPPGWDLVGEGGAPEVCQRKGASDSRGGASSRQVLQLQDWGLQLHVLALEEQQEEGQWRAKHQMTAHRQLQDHVRHLELRQAQQERQMRQQSQQLERYQQQQRQQERMFQSSDPESPGTEAAHMHFEAPSLTTAGIPDVLRGAAMYGWCLEDSAPAWSDRECSLAQLLATHDGDRCNDSPTDAGGVMHSRSMRGQDLTVLQPQSETEQRARNRVHSKDQAREPHPLQAAHLPFLPQHDGEFQCLQAGGGCPQHGGRQDAAQEWQREDGVEEVQVEGQDIAEWESVTDPLALPSDAPCAKRRLEFDGFQNQNSPPNPPSQLSDGTKSNLPSHGHPHRPPVSARDAILGPSGLDRHERALRPAKRKLEFGGGCRTATSPPALQPATCSSGRQHRRRVRISRHATAGGGGGSAGRGDLHRGAGTLSGPSRKRAMPVHTVHLALSPASHGPHSLPTDQPDLQRDLNPVPDEGKDGTMRLTPAAPSKPLHPNSSAAAAWAHSSDLPTKAPPAAVHADAAVNPAVLAAVIAPGRVSSRRRVQQQQQEQQMSNLDQEPGTLSERAALEPQTRHRVKILQLDDVHGQLGGSAAGSVLVPPSLRRADLMVARVLHQVDNKFIIAKCGGLLVALDQHAVDERIRLEAYTAAVLTALTPGPGPAQPHRAGLHSVLPAYSARLHAPQVLTLSSREVQGWEAYGSKVRLWGWMLHPGDCSTSGSRTAAAEPGVTASSSATCASDGAAGDSSGSGSALRPTYTMTHVPCVWGKALSETDLQIYLHQLADTCGSDVLPSAVLRVLKSKACRSAVMFGDPLDTAHCASLLQQLTRTVQWQHCAHGRPTSAVLLNIPALVETLQLRRKARQTVTPFALASGGGRLLPARPALDPEPPPRAGTSAGQGGPRAQSLHDTPPCVGGGGRHWAD